MSRSSKNIIDFTLVYNRHKVSIYNYVLRMVSDEILCEDIVQNVFLKFFQNLGRIKKRERAKSWLYTTARNEVYTYYRRKKVRREEMNAYDTDEVDIVSGEDPLKAFEKQEIHGLILEELEKMQYEQREAFILREYSGLSYKEIALMMNIKEELVKSRLYNTRQRLIDKIGEKLK